MKFYIKRRGRIVKDDKGEVMLFDNIDDIESKIGFHRGDQPIVWKETHSTTPYQG